MSRQHRSHVDNVETMAQLVAGLLPPLALEARISGCNPIGDQLVTQLGLSVQAAQHVDLAILARTSGTAFVVGIGSFVAYKLFCRLAKSNCMWSSLDQLIQQRSLLLSNADTDPSSSPSRTVQLADGFYAVRLGGENELLRKLDECFCRNGSGSSSDGADTARADEQVAVVQVRHASNLRRLVRKNQRMQREGIGALQQEQQHSSTSMRGVLMRAERQQQRLTRDDDEESVISDLSNLTSASRIPPNPNGVDCVPPLQLPPDDAAADTAAAHTVASASSESASSTPVSALLHCPNEEELCWENEFSSTSEADDGPDAQQSPMDDDGGETEGLFLFRERCNSLGSISQLSAMKNLERMFRGVPDWHGDECHGMGAAQPHQQLVDNALDNLRELDRLDANTNVSSSMLSGGGRLARRCWLDMEGGAGMKGPGLAAYKIAGSKSDLDISEMSSSICSRAAQQMALAEHGRKLRQKQQQQCNKSHGLWELTSLNFTFPDDGKAMSNSCTAKNNNCSSRFTHEKHVKVTATQATDTEEDNGLEQYQQQLQQQQQTPLLLTPMSAATTTAILSPSTTTMVDSVISSSYHSSLASTSALCMRQRFSSNGAELCGPDVEVMFDSAIVSDGTQSNLGFGHENDEEVGDVLAKSSSTTAQCQMSVVKDGIISRKFCTLTVPDSMINNGDDGGHSTPLTTHQYHCRSVRQQAVPATQQQPTQELQQQQRRDSSTIGSEHSLEWWF